MPTTLKARVRGIGANGVSTWSGVISRTESPTLHVERLGQVDAEDDAVHLLGTGADRVERALAHRRADVGDRRLELRHRSL